MPVARRNPPTEQPDKLRPYLFHGVQLTPSGTHAVGDCPFCGRDGKFSVEVSTGLFRCWVCGSGTVSGGGNGLVFTRLVYEHAAARTAHKASGRLGGNGHAESELDAVCGLSGDGRAFLAAVASDRGLLSPETVVEWGVAQATDGTWLVPGYGTDGRLDQVYRRSRFEDGWRLLPTPGIWQEGKVHALYLPAEDYDPNRPNVVVCEGWPDAAALWEVWDRTPGDTNIVAVPGCNVWRDSWTSMCQGKNVIIIFDSDHPKKYSTNSARVSRAGYDGVVRVTKRLSGVALSVSWLKWGPDGYDKDKPSGWDVRDQLVNSIDRRAALKELLDRIEPTPREWFNPSVHPTGRSSAKSIEAIACSSMAECEKAWGEALRWRPMMSEALSVLLAVCASTQQAGNQLFVQLVGSAGSGKTTMCDGLLVSDHCHHLEHLTGFHSGWKKPDEQGKDCSLIARINGKTLVTPEADVLISSPNFRQIMAQQRRIFDGKSGATYKNTDVDTFYSALRTPWIMAGTWAMMDHDQSHLGDRFVRFMIQDPPDTERRSILRSALRSERSAMLERANNTAGSIVDEKTRYAHALTGGYVDWLREHVEEELAKIDVSVAAEDYCIDLAELSADLRARPSEDNRKTLEAHESKELPTRLARQNIRLASCLAVVLNKHEIDKEVLGITRKVALDTAAGHSLNIVRWLCSPNVKDSGGRIYQECGGLMDGFLQTWTNMSYERLQKYMTFLRNIGVVTWVQVKSTHGAWLLTDRVYELYLRVMNGK